MSNWAIWHLDNNIHLGVGVGDWGVADIPLGQNWEYTIYSLHELQPNGSLNELSWQIIVIFSI